MAESVNHTVGMALYGWNRELRWLIALCLLVVVLVATVIIRDFSQPSTPGVTRQEIRIGTSLVMDGPLSQTGLAYYAGLRAAIGTANAQGGVHGRKIRLIALNDGYEPLRCVLNTRELIGQESVFALTSYFGTPTSVKAQPIWTGARVPVVGFYSGSRGLREPFSPYNFHTRASYEQEVHALVNLFANDLGLKRVAIFCQYDSFGQTVRRDIKAILSQHNLKIVSEGSYPRNSSDIESGLKQILKGDPQAIIMVSAAGAASRLVREARLNLHHPVVFGAVSFVGAEAFLDTMGKDGNGCYVSQVVPFYNGVEAQVEKDYRRDLKSISPELSPSFAGLEGYINGRVLVEGLERAGRTPTRDRFIEALETISGEPFGPGFKLAFAPKKHEGSSSVYMTMIKDGKYELLNVKD